MNLLHERDLPASGTTTFRHGRVGSLVVLAVLVSPLVLAFAYTPHIVDEARKLSTLAWFVVASMALVCVPLWAILFGASKAVVRASFRASNWIARTAADGVYVNLRSYLNEYEPSDGPSAVFLAWDEIESARRVTEVLLRRDADGDVAQYTRWLELRLTRVDTATIAAILHAERTRPTRASSFIGITSRLRFRHVAALVLAENRLRFTWGGSKLFTAIGQHTRLGEPSREHLEDARKATLESRLSALCQRGEHLAAVQVAREELRLPLAAARDLVERVNREAA